MFRKTMLCLLATLAGTVLAGYGQRTGEVGDMSESTKLPCCENRFPRLFSARSRVSKSPLQTATRAARRSQYSARR